MRYKHQTIESSTCRNAHIRPKNAKRNVYQQDIPNSLIGLSSEPTLLRCLPEPALALPPREVPKLLTTHLGNVRLSAVTSRWEEDYRYLENDTRRSHVQAPAPASLPEPTSPLTQCCFCILPFFRSQMNVTHRLLAAGHHRFTSAQPLCKIVTSSTSRELNQESYFLTLFSQVCIRMTYAKPWQLCNRSLHVTEPLI